MLRLVRTGKLCYLPMFWQSGSFTENEFPERDRRYEFMSVEIDY